MGEQETATKEGWGRPSSSRKFHYFRDGASLCGRWGFAFGLPLDPDTEQQTKDDCAPCWRARQKEKAA